MSDLVDGGLRWKLFADLPEHEYQDVRSKTNEVPRGAKADPFFVRQGEVGESVFFIEQGHVGVLVKPPGGGREATIRVLGPSDHFGELSVLEPGQSKERMASVKALDREVVARCLNRHDLDVLRKVHPAVDKALLNALAKEVARLSEEVVYALHRGLPAKLARKLVYLEGIYRHHPGEPEVEIPLNQTQLGDLCGAHRVDVNPEIGTLRRLGYIAPRGEPNENMRTIRIANLAKLRRRAGLPPETPSPHR